MHAAGEDLRICLFQTGQLPRRVFDVQIAAGLVGFSYPLSLGNLVGQVLGVSRRRRRDADRLAAPAALRGPARLRPGRRALPPGPRRLTSPRGSAELGRTAWAEEEFADFVDVDRATGRRGALATAAGPAPARPPGAGDGPAARGLARGRGAAAEPAAAPAHARRPARRDRQAAADESARPRGPPRLQPPAPLSRSDEILRVLDEARDVPEDQLPEPAARYEEPPGPLDGRQPALRGAGPVLRPAPDRGLAGRQRRPISST